MTLPNGYGAVILVACGTIGLNVWQSLQMRFIREKLGVTYPTMYTVAGVTKMKKDDGRLLTDDECKLFNCYQRAHQNFLETVAMVLMVMLLGGLRHPYVCAGFGILYLVGRISYALGYYTGNPNNRRWGFLTPVAILGMLGTAVKVGIESL
eukprot:CAMPEP_0113846522 /NCGR_PEP_ID=MMETSP0372-20130328/1352_1 /TAXON_ID=340204 /ORGANISM="Lankesteria abbotti" /LENGTH=150 /DNA_ID=CAMNT_0000815671 /DNA_START=27 /DNA_END=479 /DNA_ORIENTATION=- /assembly_acc=CAM_ASM_000359